MIDTEAILKQTAHRPWPLPEGPWVMVQQWSDLLFAHWAVEPEIVRPLVATELELDLYGGKAWVGLTPFRMTDIRMRGLPAIPGAGSFLEMNLRTYVRAGVKGTNREHRAPGFEAGDARTRPGVYFFSLDASNLPAVLGARLGFGLPYHWSTMTARKEEEWIHYISARKQGEARAVLRYRPVGGVLAKKSELEIFLTERYCLYEVRMGAVMMTEIHHVAWPLQKAEAILAENSVGTAAGMDLRRVPDHLHFSRELDVLVFPPGQAA